MNSWNEPSVQEKNAFYQSMHPRWKEVMTLLAADRPPEWEGFRFEAKVERDPGSTRFSLLTTFTDRVSNRSRGRTPPHILEMVARLQADYANFWSPMAWSLVRIEQIWNRDTKSWSYETNWEY